MKKQTIFDKYFNKQEEPTMIPRDVVKMIDFVVDHVVMNVHPDIWDETADYMINQLKDKMIDKTGHPVLGAKFIAEVKDKVIRQEQNQNFQVLINAE